MKLVRRSAKALLFFAERHCLNVNSAEPFVFDVKVGLLKYCFVMLQKSLSGDIFLRSTTLSGIESKNSLRKIIFGSEK